MVLSITRRFLKGRQFVPVDTKTVSLKLLVVLKFSWNVVHLEGIELLLSCTKYPPSFSETR